MYSGTVGKHDLPNYAYIRRDLALTFNREEVLELIHGCEYGRHSGITHAVLPEGHVSSGWEQIDENTFIKRRRNA